MPDKKERKKWKKIFYSRITLILLVFLLVFLGKATWQMYTKKVETSEARQESREELDQIQEKKENLQKKIGQLSTARGVEEIIRENFDVAKEGEGVIVLVDDESKNDNKKPPEKSWWQKLLGFFK